MSRVDGSARNGKPPAKPVWSCCGGNVTDLAVAFRHSLSEGSISMIGGGEITAVPMIDIGQASKFAKLEPVCQGV